MWYPRHHAAHYVKACLQWRLPPSPTQLAFACREGMSGIYATFFGPNGDQKLNLSNLEKFLNRLHLELVHLEFSFYDEQSTVKTFTCQDHAAVVANSDWLCTLWAFGLRILVCLIFTICMEDCLMELSLLTSISWGMEDQCQAASYMQCRK